jgi:hypothetical protein
MPTPTGPVTLGDVIREDKLLWVYCRDCYHERDVNPANVPLPADTSVAGNWKEDEMLAVRVTGSGNKAGVLSQVAWWRCDAVAQQTSRMTMIVVVGHGAEGLVLAHQRHNAGSTNSKAITKNKSTVPMMIVRRTKTSGSLSPLIASNASASRCYRATSCARTET